MRKLLLFLAVPVSLAACATVPGVPTSVGTAATVADAVVPVKPADVANRTVLDEQGALGVELAYKAFRTALETATDAGRLHGAQATTAAGLDNRAYAATQAARAAYRTGNAISYTQAVTEARAAINAALGAIGSN